MSDRFPFATLPWPGDPHFGTMRWPSGTRQYDVLTTNFGDPLAPGGPGLAWLDEGLVPGKLEVDGSGNIPAIDENGVSFPLTVTAGAVDWIDENGVQGTFPLT